MRSSLIQLVVKDRESISTSNTSHERTAANRSVATECIARNVQLTWMLFMCHLRAPMICFMLALPISQFSISIYELRQTIPETNPRNCLLSANPFKHLVKFSISCVTAHQVAVLCSCITTEIK